MAGIASQRTTAQTRITWGTAGSRVASAVGRLLRLRDLRSVRWIRTAAAVVVIAIVVRAFLPLIITAYVNRVLERMPGYRGRIGDVDLSLIRGAYVIENIRIEKTSGSIPVPFFSAKEVDLSVEWRALLNASLVGEVEFVNPKVNFVQGPSPKHSQSGGGANFIDRLEELFPLRLNSFDVRDGEVHFRNFHSSPPVDIFLDQISMHGVNFTNSLELSKSLVASVDAKGRAMRHGTMAGHLDVNPFADDPTFNLDFKLERIELTKLNDFFRAYVGVDVESGRFRVYSEMAAYDGRFTGYVKPLFENMEILDVSEDIGNPIQFVWEALVGGVAGVLTNPEGNVATTIPYSGRFDDPKADMLETLGGLFKNAFIRALQPGIEDRINLGQAKSDEDADEDDKDRR